jgi:hypothetical protein
MKSIRNIPLDRLRTENITLFSAAFADRDQTPITTSIVLNDTGILEENDRKDAVLWASSWYAFFIAYQLCEEGLLKLDDKLCDVLPFLAFNDKSQKTIAIRDLLTQSSDLPNRFDYGFATSRPDRNYLKYLVKGARSFRQSPRNPKLNPVDLGLLELVLEHVSELSYAQLFDKYVVLTMGFKHTILCDEIVESASNLKQGKNRLYFNGLAFAGVLASAEEFVTFARSFKSIVELFESKYTLDTSAWFNGFSLNGEVRYLYVDTLNIQRFVLLSSQNKVFSVSSNAKGDMLPLCLDLAQDQGISALAYRDLPIEHTIEKAASGLFAGKGKIVMLADIADTQGIIKLNKRSYLIENNVSDNDIKLQRIVMQAIDSIPSITWWHAGNADCLLSKIHPGENLSRLEWFLRPRFRKEAPNSMLTKPVYHVIDSHLALPGVDLPSSWDDDCEELRHEEDKVVQGLHEYLPLSRIVSDASRLVVEEGKIAWTKSSKNLDTIKLIGTIVMIALDNSGKIRFDSRKNTGLPAFDEEMYYGFFGKKDGEVLPVWETKALEVVSE